MESSRQVLKKLVCCPILRHLLSQSVGPLWITGRSPSPGRKRPLSPSPLLLLSRFYPFFLFASYIPLSFLPPSRPNPQPFPKPSRLPFLFPSAAAESRHYGLAISVNRSPIGAADGRTAAEGGRGDALVASVGH